MDAHTIKKSLVNYKRNIELVEHLTWRLEEMSTKYYEGGTSSVIRLPDGSPQDRSCIISEFVVKEHDMQVEIALLSQEIEIADKFINNIHKHRNMIMDKYFNRLSYRELCDKYDYSKSQIFKIIQSEIENQSDL